MMSAEEDYDRWRIALYYCYIKIDDGTSHVEFQRTTCGALQLTGRIRVAPEGINGVLSGEHDRLVAYEAALREELSSFAAGEGVDGNCELDVKYCRLRDDLPVHAQLFETLLVQPTRRVICLVDEPTTSRPSKRGGAKSVQTLPSVIQEVWEDVRNEAVLTDDKHLSPAEWDEHLASLGPHENAILLDCRNSYESAIGYFEAPNATTLLTNTRKYSELPNVFLEQRERLASCTHVFAYCTGGVRCEVATKFLRRLLDGSSTSEGGSGPEIYQLHGGIQRYLDHHHQQQEDRSELPLHSAESAGHENYFKGKNFVFDPRRTDPVHGTTRVGRCMVCDALHDYDNGHAPAEASGESRCVNCRVLLLVCPRCRPTVTCWGQDPQSGCDEVAEKPKLYCGGVDASCLHRPPVRLIVNAESVAL